MRSPFSSPPNSQGSTITMSLSRTQSFLLSLPGIRQILVFASRQRTRMREPPSRCSRIPKTSWPLGSLMRVISYCSFCSLSSSSFLVLIQNHNRGCVYISLPEEFPEEISLHQIQRHVRLKIDKAIRLFAKLLRTGFAECDHFHAASHGPAKMLKKRNKVSIP